MSRKGWGEHYTPSKVPGLPPKGQLAAFFFGETGVSTSFEKVLTAARFIVAIANPTGGF